MNTYNTLTAWISWRVFLLINFFAQLFGFGKQAAEEVAQSKEALKKGTGYEQTKCNAFYEFLWRVSSGNFARVDMSALSFMLGALYLVLVNVAGVTALYGPYLAGVAWFLLGIGALGFVWAAVHTQFLRWPVEKDEYDRQIDLLATVGVAARKPLGLAGSVLVFLMLLVDAAMISIVAIDYAADLPRNIQLIGGVAIGVVFALCLVWITHHTGEQLYRGAHHKKLISIIRDERMSSGDKKTSSLEKQIKKFGFPFLISEKPFMAKYGWLLLAIGFVVLIVGLATYARYNQNSNILLEQMGVNIFDSSSNPNRSETFNTQNQNNMDILRTASMESQRKAMIAGISLLAVVFVIVQIVAVTLAHRHSFALEGGEDRLAYERVRQYRQQMLSNRDGNVTLTRSQQMVANKARSFFSNYWTALKKASYQAGRTEELDVLEKRGAFDFEKYAFERLQRDDAKLN